MSWLTKLIYKPTKQESDLRPSGKERNERDGIIINSTSNENNDTTNDKQLPQFFSHQQQLFLELKQCFGNMDRNQKLIDFVVSLNPRYNSWESNEDFKFLLDAYRDRYNYTSRFYYSTSTKKPKMNEVFSIGKDEDFARHLASMLSKNVIAISQALTSESEANLTEDQKKMTSNVILLLAFLNILSKQSNNLEFLNNSRILSHVLQILKLVSLKLNSIMSHLLHPHELVTSVNHEDAFQIWWNHLKLVLGYCMQVLANFCGDCGANQKVPHEFKVALVKLGLPRIFKDILKLLRDIRIHCETSASHSKLDVIQQTVQLELLLLNCTSFLAQENTSAQNALRDIEMIETALGNMNWPRSSAEETHNEHPQLEFMIQLVSLHFLSRMIADNSQNYQRVSELGGFERIMDFILWTYVYFGKSDTEFEIGEQGKLDFLKDFICSKLELGLVFDTLFTFCASGAVRTTKEDRGILPLYFLNHNYHLAETMQNNAPVISLHQEAVMKTTLSLLLDLFNSDIRNTSENNAARLQLRDQAPVVQLFVVQFIEQLVVELGANAGKILNDIKLWDVLFSPYFVTWKMSPRPVLFECIHEQVLSLVEAIAILQNYDNSSECVRLLTLLEENIEEDKVLIDASNCLGNILHRNPNQTINVLIHKGALALVERVMHVQLKRRLEKQPGNSVNKEIMLAVMNFHGELLINEDINMKLTSNAQTEVREILFKILEADGELRDAALSQIISLIRTRVVLKFKIKPTKQTAEEIDADINKLVTIYLDFVSSQTDFLLKEDLFMLCVSLMDGISHIMSLSGLTKPQRKFLQDCFVDCGAFIKILTPLNLTTHNPENDATRNSMKLGDLAVHVLNALMVLLCRNTRNKEIFSQTIGYDQLCKVILNATARNPSARVLQAILNMLVDSDFRMEEFHQIKNGDAIVLLLSLLPYFQKPEQLYLLQVLDQLSKRSSVNQSLMCKFKAIPLLIKLLHSDQHSSLIEDTSAHIDDPDLVEQTIKLIESAGAHSISVRDLKSIIGLVKARDKARPRYSISLLKALQNMTQRNSGPDVFFDLDGHKSTIFLPNLNRWPLKGFTFCMWFRVESFNPPTNVALKSNHNQRIFSFLSTDASEGVECWLKEGQLHYSVVMSSKNYDHTFNYTFVESQWYFLAIAHSKSLLASSEIKLFVNGTQVEKATGKYPALSTQLTRNRICSGTTIERSTVRKTESFDHVTTVRSCNFFFGHVGSIYLFEDALTATFITQIYSLGPNYLGNFLPENSSRNMDTSIFDSTLAKLQLFHYNSKSLNGKTLIDNSPEKSIDKRFDGKLISVNISATRDIRNIIHSIGGIKTLFPTFWQLDYLEAENQTTTDRYCVELLKLMGCMMQNHILNQEDMLRSKGFKVINLALQFASSYHLSQTSLGVIRDILKKITDPELFEDGTSHLLLDFRIWIYTDISTQKDWISSLLDIVNERDLSFFGRVNAIQLLLDILLQGYWQNPDSRVPHLFAPNKKFSMEDRRCIGSRLSQEGIEELSTILFEGIRTMMISSHKQSLGFEQMEPLIRFLVCSKDASKIVAILDLFLHMAVTTHQQLQMLTIFQEVVDYKSCTSLFLPLLQHPSEQVRLASLRLCVLLAKWSCELTSRPRSQTPRSQALNKPGGPPSPSTSSGSLFLTASSSNLTPKKSATTGSIFLSGSMSSDTNVILGQELELIIATFLDSTLQQETELSIETRNTLLDLLLGQFYSRPSSTSYELPTSKDIENPQFMTALLKLLNWFKKIPIPGLNDAVVTTLHILNILLAVPRNLDTFAKSESWIQSVVSLTDGITGSLQKQVGAIFAKVILNWISQSTFPVTALSGLVASIITHFYNVSADQNVDSQTANENTKLFLRFIFAVVTRDLLLSSNPKIALSPEKSKSQTLPVNNDTKSKMGVLALLFHLEDWLFYNVSLKQSESSQASVAVAPKLGIESWEDFALCIDTLKLIDQFNLLSSESAQLRITSSEILDTKSRNGGAQRLALRLCLAGLEFLIATDNLQPDFDDACREMTSHIRKVLSRYFNTRLSTSTPSVGESDDSAINKQTAYVLYNLLILLRELPSHDHNKTEDKFTRICGRITPLVRDLLKKYRLLLTSEAHLGAKSKSIANTLSIFFDISSQHSLSDPDNMNEDPVGPPNSESCVVSKHFQEFSEDWNVIAEHLQNFNSEIKLLETAFCAMIAEAYQGSALSKQKPIGQIELPKTYNDLLETVINRELARRHDMLESLRDHNVSAMRVWKDIQRSLDNERGAWGNPFSKIKTYWKLDKTENFSRMRLKLKRNYQFNDHKDAAPESKESKSNQNTDNSFSNTELLKSAIKLKAAEDFTFEDENAASELEDSILPSSLAMESTDLLNRDKAKDSFLESEKPVVSVYCELISHSDCYPGELDITPNYLKFREKRPDNDESQNMNLEVKDREWPLSQIREIHLRRYLLVRSALEIFLLDHTNFFLNFNKADRDKVHKKILSLQPPNLVYVDKLSPEEILRKSDLTKRWQARQISNFDYLMQLNTIAGRTYNDLTQYPVFPWVIADYTSPELDLSNPAMYRDLSKPIGALNPQRLEDFKERYRTFDDPVIPKFHYGSHYSSAATVCHYLIRLEPFTTQFLKLQGGHFDHADRMFHSVPQTWHNCLHASSDVKELIPEFFYMPEFLANSNEFDLGTKQNGIKLNDVVLPPWAKTPEDFIRIHRQALESDYVSEHLHEWIDLIFGFKQRGRNSIEAFNVFFYLTYEGSVDIEAIQDAHERKATLDQISNFGQTPIQLLNKPHPKRLLAESSSKPWLSVQKLNAFFVQVSANETPIVFIGMPETNLNSYLYLGVTDKIVTLSEELVIGSHRWLPTTPNTSQAPFTFELDPTLISKKPISANLSNEIVPSPHCFAVTSDGKILISGGHWDNSFKLTAVETSKLLHSVVYHQDIITCVALSTDSKTLITGSKDSTVVVWDIQTKGTNIMRVEPVHVLYGHDDEVTCLAVNAELDVAVSGSKDGSIIVHTLKRGKYVRSIFHPKRYEISGVALSDQGHIAVYTAGDLLINLYSINGKWLTSCELNSRVSHMIISPDFYLITGSEKGFVTIRSLYNLQVVHRFNAASACRSLAVGDRHLLIGLADGKILFICQ